MEEYLKDDMGSDPKRMSYLKDLTPTSKTKIPEDKTTILIDLSKNLIKCKICKEVKELEGYNDLFLNKDLIATFKQEHKNCICKPVEINEDEQEEISPN